MSRALKCSSVRSAVEQQLMMYSLIMHASFPVVLLYLEYSCILQVVKIVPFSRVKFNNNEKIRKKKMKLPAEFVVQYSYIKGTAGR